MSYAVDSPTYEIAGETRQSMVYTKDMLLKT